MIRFIDFLKLLEVFNEESEQRLNNFTEEKTEFIKNGVKSTMTTTFNEKGIVVSVAVETSLVKDLNPTKEEKEKIYQEELGKLQAKLEEAKEKEDYIACAKIKKDIDNLKSLKEFIK